MPNTLQTFYLGSDYPIGCEITLHNNENREFLNLGVLGILQILVQSEGNFLRVCLEGVEHLNLKDFPVLFSFMLCDDLGDRMGVAWEGGSRGKSSMYTCS